MNPALFEEYILAPPLRKSKRRQAVGLAVTTVVHALLLWVVIKARFEVKMFPVEKRATTVYIGPRIKVELPPDYEKSLPSLHALESGEDILMRSVRRGPRTNRTTPTAEPTAEVSSGASTASPATSGSPWGLVLNYRPGSEKGAVPEFDLRRSSEPSGAGGGRSPSPRAVDPRLKSYPSMEFMGSGPGGGGHALARSSTGDRILYRGRLPAGLKDYDLTAWGRQVVEVVQRHWILPVTRADLKGGKVGVTVFVDKDGRVTLIRIDNSSNTALLDRSVLAAITASLPFPPLPGDFPNTNLETFFLFDCHEK